MNYDMHHWVPPMYNTMQQFAEIHPDDPKMYRTFFYNAITSPTRYICVPYPTGFTEKSHQQYGSHIQCT